MLLMRQVVRQEARIAGCLRQAVAMGDGKMKSIFEAYGCVFQQRSCSADESLETVELVGREIFIRIEEKFEQGRNHTYTGDVFLVQSSPKGRAFEFPVQNQAPSTIQGGNERDHHSIHMVDRKHTHHTIILAKVMPRGERVGVD